MRWNRSSKDTLELSLISSSFFLAIRFSATLRAVFSSVLSKISPAWGTSLRPKTSTGVEGRAFLTFSPRSLTMARTLPKLVPAIMVSPMCRVPRCTKTVATGPRPLSNCASMMVPCAGRFGLAFSSCISATKRIISKRSVIPVF